MHSFYEFRVQEKYADLVFSPDDGEYLGDGIRKVVLRDDDPKLAEVERISKQVRAEYDDYFFAGWDIRRKYTRKELGEAEIFHVKLRPFFMPAGEECGTQYDESVACPLCGGGRRQVSDLILDLRKIPKGRDITSTLADEWIVSQRLAGLMFDAKLTGFELRPVGHKARYRDDTIFLERLYSGRKAIEIAAAQGISLESWEWTVWINHPDQQELTGQIDREHTALGERQDRRRAKPLPLWYQLVVPSSVGTTQPPTTFGIKTFDYDEKGRERCPLGNVGGHLSGLSLLSEISIARSAWDGSDLAVTTNLINCRRGLIAPAPMLLVSPRFWRILQDHKLKAYRFDVAHLV